MRPVGADPEWHGSFQTPGILVEILVTVSPDGTVKNTTIQKSSGAYGTDYGAIENARNSVYKAKMADCKAVEGTYLFRELFLPED